MATYYGTHVTLLNLTGLTLLNTVNKKFSLNVYIYNYVELQIYFQVFP